MSGIYKNYNPIFESLRREVFEKEVKGDPELLVRIIYDMIVNLIMVGSDPAIKTPDGFKAYADQIVKSTSVESLKKEFVTKIDQMIKMDKPQAESLMAHKQYLENAFNDLESVMGKSENTSKMVMDLIAKFTKETIEGLKKKTQDIAYESLVTRYVSEKRDRTGEEAESEEGEASKWFTQLSKDLLDSSVSFEGETSSAVSNPTIGSNPEIKKFDEMAKQFVERAKKLAITSGRRGFMGMGKIETASGTMKGKDYKVKAQNLLNEIIRQREEFNKTRYRLANLPAPPPTVCPTGQKWDGQKCANIDPTPVIGGGGGTSTGGGENKPRPKKEKDPVPVPVPVTETCDFPIAIGSKKCEVVQELQKKLIGLGQCVADILNPKGGADGKYGKVTAKLTNIFYAYITKSKTFNPEGSLTKEIYDAIMGYGGSVTPQPIKTIDGNPDIIRKAQEDSQKRESFDTEKFGKRVFEREYKIGTSVLSFDDFSEVLSEAGYIYEEGTPGNPGDTGPYKPPAPPVPQQSGKDVAKCICDSYASGQIDGSCFNVIIPPPNPTGPDPNPTGPTGPTGPVPPIREDWKGLKYVDTGSYPVSFDESLLSFWSKELALTAVSFLIPGSGLILKAGSTGLKSLGTRAAASVGAKKLAGKIAGRAATTVARRTGTSAASLLWGKSGKYLAQYGGKFAVLMPQRTAAGLIGGTVGGAAVDFLSGRDTFIITVAEGYIDRNVVLGVANGLVNTLDGYCSDDDWACITQILSVIRGAWTVDAGGDPVSVWAVIKETYQTDEGETLIEDIESVSAKFGEVEGYPNLRSVKPLNGLKEVDWDVARAETVSFVGVLEKNESAMAQNIEALKKVPEYVAAFVEGRFIEYNEEGEILGKEGKGGEGYNEDAESGDESPSTTATAENKPETKNKEQKL